MFARGFKVTSTAAQTTRRGLLGSTRAYASKSDGVTRRVLRPVYLAGLTAVAVGFTLYSLDSRARVHRYVITPLMRYFLDGEQAHRWAIEAAKHGLIPRDWHHDDDTLRVTVSRASRR